MPLKRKSFFAFLLLCIAYISNAQKELEVLSKTKDDTQNKAALKRADKAFQQAAYADAIIEYELFLKKNPDYTEALRNLSTCYDLINNPAESEKYLAKLVATSQARDMDLLHYAQVLLINNKPDEAKKQCANYLSKNPNDERALMLLTAINNRDTYYKDSAYVKVVQLNINTLNPEFCPVLFNKELIFVASKPSTSVIKREHSWTGDAFYSLYSATKKDSLHFEKTQKYMSFLSTKYNNGPISINSKGTELFYTQNGNTPKKGDKTIRLRLFSVEGNGMGGWKDVPKPFIYNDDSYSCMHPSISSDGKRLYFASDMKGGQGNSDIWYCESEGNGTWGKPINAGKGINTKGNETFPFITQDNVLFFSSDSRDGLGGIDIYRSEINGTTFEAAENMGFPLNSTYDDFGISFYNVKSGYFSSNRINKNIDDDIFYVWNNKPIKQKLQIKVSDSTNTTTLATMLKMVEIGKTDTLTLQSDSGIFITKALPDKNYLLIAHCGNGYVQKTSAVTVMSDTKMIDVFVNKKSDNCVYGLVIDKTTQKPVSGLLLNIDDEDGNKIYETVTDSSGSYKMCKLIPNKKYFIGTIKKPDYFSQTESFILLPQTELEKNVYVQRIEIGKGIKIENIYFDLGKFNIKPESAVELDKIVKLMIENPDIIIELGSHTDCRGSKTANTSLSDKRAKSSAAYIVSKSIAKNRVRGKGYGETQLVNNCGCEGAVKSDCTEDFHAVNRRTEFKVIGFIKPTKIK